MEANQSTALVIKEHDFQEAKSSLKKYTEQAKKKVGLSRVPDDGGLFKLGNHKVTGSELNEITKQIQDHLIRINNLNQGLVDEFGQVYKAFEYLDKDYISGIVTSIKAAEEVSKKEQQDRKDIKELIEQHKQSIEILKKFKTDIEKIKHLTDVDKAWELIDKQTKISKELSDNMTSLAKVKHIKDVDSIHSDLEKVKNDFTKTSEKQVEYLAELKSVRKYCDNLSTIKHIKDIDKLWENSEIIARDIEIINQSAKIQSEAISAFDEIIRSLQEKQRQYIEKINHLVSDFHDDFSNQVRTFTEVQTTKLSDIETAHAKTVEQFVNEQREQLSANEIGQNERYDCVIKEQFLILNKIENAQKEMLEQLSVDQAATLEQLSNEQSANWEKTIKSLEEERTIINKQVCSITQKVKFSYIVAGGAVALTIVQLFLNVLGVI